MSHVDLEELLPRRYSALLYDETTSLDTLIRFVAGADLAYDGPSAIWLLDGNTKTWKRLEHGVYIVKRWETSDYVVMQPAAIITKFSIISK